MPPGDLLKHSSSLALERDLIPAWCPLASSWYLSSSLLLIFSLLLPPPPSCIFLFYSCLPAVSLLPTSSCHFDLKQSPKPTCVRGFYTDSGGFFFFFGSSHRYKASLLIGDNFYTKRPCKVEPLPPNCALKSLSCL